MRGITKRFGPVVALSAVDLQVDAGQVVGLIGQNGAGKSTLLRVLGGLYPPDEGQIRIGGRPVSIPSPAAAAALGISIIHQEFSLIGHLSVAENLLLGREPVGRLGLVDRRRRRETAASLLRRLGLELDPDRPVDGLSVAEKQQVEIARALSLDARIFVMDEPTAALNGVAVERLLGVVRALKAEGKAVIFVSHRLEEVFAIADEVVVLRDGRRVGHLTRPEMRAETAVRLMTGREHPPSAGGGRRCPGRDLVLEVRGLTVPGAFYDVTFGVGRGEVVALVGLEGQGQREVLRALFGLLPRHRGQVLVDGRPVRLASPRDAIRCGLGFVPEERKTEGLCLSRSVAENVAMATLERRQVAGFVRMARERRTVEGLIGRLRIATPSPAQRVDRLSGGNQQKVVIARWLVTRPKVMLFSEPTRGIDVAAKEEVYQLIERLASEGAGILLTSSDMQEVLRLADRILVMYEGRLVAEFSPDSLSAAELTRAQWGFAAGGAGARAG